jgi:hypothetical protein
LAKHALGLAELAINEVGLLRSTVLASVASVPVPAGPQVFRLDGALDLDAEEVTVDEGHCCGSAVRQRLSRAAGAVLVYTSGLRVFAAAAADSRPKQDAKLKDKLPVVSKMQKKVRRAVAARAALEPRNIWPAGHLMLVGCSLGLLFAGCCLLPRSPVVRGPVGGFGGGGLDRFEQLFEHDGGGPACRCSIEGDDTVSQLRFYDDEVFEDSEFEDWAEGCRLHCDGWESQLVEDDEGHEVEGY